MDILLPIRAKRDLFSATVTSLEFKLTGATRQNNKEKVTTGINKLKIENEVHKRKAGTVLESKNASKETLYKICCKKF